MRKLLFTVLLLLGGTFTSVVYGIEQTDIPMEIVKEGSSSNNNPKGPTVSLVIHQDGRILTMPPSSVDFVLQLRDGLGNVAYSSFLPVGTCQVVLPSALTGTFELRLVASTYYYLGDITL